MGQTSMSSGLLTFQQDGLKLLLLLLLMLLLEMMKTRCR